MDYGETSVEGVVERIVYFNDDTCYCIAVMKPTSRTEKKESITITGVMPAVQCGETVLVKGIWSRHPQYGAQIKVREFESRLPSGVYGIEKYSPKFVIIDSVQTMYSEEITAAAGSVSQVREITSQVMRVCKSRQITTIIIGHVTKEGNIAGPRVLEHMVDCVLYLEGERYFSYRILRGVKNRFGSTNEIGMFEMQEEGMCEITNPSDILITEREDNAAGSCIVSCMEGTRPILVELQALTSQTIFGYPKRTANGIDYNRLALLIAVLEKRCGLQLGSQDVYLNVVGGLKINEPSIDLGIMLVTASSFKNKPIPKDMVIIGEVGLTGEVRRINAIEKRLKEAEKLGFKSCIIPESNKRDLKDKFKLDIICVKNINEAMKKVGL